MRPARIARAPPGVEPGRLAVTARPRGPRAGVEPAFREPQSRVLPLDDHGHTARPGCGGGGRTPPPRPWVAPAPRAHEARMLPGTPRRDGGDGDPRQAAGRIRTVRKNRFPARLLGGCQVQFWRQRRIQVEEERGPRPPYPILARPAWRRSRGPVG